jgi:hypothetical protein
VSSGSYDLSKLCIPLEINGSQADKMDILIIPINFSKEDRVNKFYSMAQKAQQTFRQTNLPDDVQKKMNWYILNIDHKDFNAPLFQNYDNTGEDGLLDFGIAANFCGRDLFMIVWNTPGQAGVAYKGVGAVVGSLSIEQGRLVFAHEWGHAGGDLNDEYWVKGNNGKFGGPNCADIPANSTPSTDPCPQEYYGYGDTHKCGASANNAEYKEPCPQWDCNQISCSARARQLLENAGCYPRCGGSLSYRAAPNSIMSSLSDIDHNLYSGPSLVHIIEKVFNKYK